MAPLIAITVLSLMTGLALAAPQNLPPKVVGAAQQLGHTTDPEFSTDYYSDGGAGGHVNGYNLITLSDARTKATGYGLVHTAYAYFGVKNATDPTQITIIGNYTRNPHFYLPGPNGFNCGQGVVASTPNDPVQCSAFGPGPNTAMVQIPGNQTGGITAWTVHNATKGGGNVLFNTLIEFNVVDPQTLIDSNTNIPSKRTFEQFYTVDQPMYGSGGIASDSSKIYFLALDNAGFKLATVNASARANRSAYQYWNNSTQKYQSQIPSLNDAPSTLLDPSFPTDNIFGTDLFYSPYFQTWIITYSGADSYGAKYLAVAYSKTGLVTGPYVDIGGVFKPDLDPECRNNPAAGYQVTYLVHSHPGWDPSGKTLLVSWISCNAFTDMAIITWK